MSEVVVAGVGMIPFAKPGNSEDWDVMAEKAPPQRRRAASTCCAFPQSDDVSGEVLLVAGGMNL